MIITKIYAFFGIILTILWLMYAVSKHAVKHDHYFDTLQEQIKAKLVVDNSVTYLVKYTFWYIVTAIAVFAVSFI